MKTRLIGALLAIVLAAGGTVVLTGYVNGADARASAGAAFVQVYVVSGDIAAGTPIEEATNLIAAKKIPALAATAGRVSDLIALKGKVASVALIPGEQLLTARWVKPENLDTAGKVVVPDGLQTVTIALPVERVVGGTVKAGDTVGVVISATLKPADSQEVPVTRQVFHEVLVTAVQAGTTTPPAEGTGTAETSATSVMVTLARNTADIEKLVWGQEFGSVWLTIEPEGADQSGSRVVNGGVVFE